MSERAIPVPPTSAPILPDDFQDELRASWHRFVDRVAPLRPDLHRYCRRLTRDVWDAEDLVQDTLLRAFGHLGHLGQPVRDPRAYLFRTATNVWIDALRRRELEAGSAPAKGSGVVGAALEPPERGTEMRQAGERLLQRLAPQERAAVVLKDVFEMSLDEIAEILATTPGAVKAALHRGRGRLAEPDDGPAAGRPRPSEALIDRFLAAYHRADVAGLVALLADGGSAENVGCGLQYGRETFEGERHFFHHVVHGHEEWPEALQPEAVRVERGSYLGEPLVLGFATRRGREALEVILRFEEQEGRIARVRGYAFCPETMREVGAALGLRVRTGLYRFPTPEPGGYYTAPAAGREGAGGPR
jgi:RNA polymerase sigma-70 factor (ECF subfamily)